MRLNPRLLSVFFCLFAAISSAQALDCNPGQALNSELVAEIKKEELTTQASGMMPGAQVVTGIRAIRVLYCTTDWNGRRTEASGLWIYPSDFHSNAQHLISFQHGTEVERALSPSFLKSMESKLGLVATAVTGFQIAMPDYLGMGVSKLFHPYLHEQTEGTASRDLLLAIEDLAARTKRVVAQRYYLMGYSQGGHATMALFRAMGWTKRLSSKIAAVAPMAGPHDLAGASLDLTLKTPYPHVSNIFTGYTLLSFNQVYSLTSRLDLVIQAEHASKFPRWFDGVTPFGKIAEEIPALPSQLLEPDFLKGLTDARATTKAGKMAQRLKRIMAMNSIVGRGFELESLKRTPIRVIHSPGDDMVAYANSPRLVSYLRSQGAQKVELVDNIFEKDGKQLGHGQAGVPAILNGFQWIIGIALKN